VLVVTVSELVDMVARWNCFWKSSWILGVMVDAWIVRQCHELGKPLSVARQAKPEHSTRLT